MCNKREVDTAISDGRPLTQDAHVVSAVLLGLLDDSGQRVREVLKQGVLLVDLHA